MKPLSKTRQQKTTPDISIAWPARILKDGSFAINLPELSGLFRNQLLDQRGLPV